MTMSKKLLVLLGCLVVAACSSDNGTAPDDDNGGGGGGGGGVTHADSVWVQDIGSLATEMEQWASESPDTIAARSLAYLQGLPTVADAGIFSGTTTIWVTFANGYDLVIPNNREPSSMADTLVDAASAPAPRSTVAPRKITIPAGRRMMTALAVPETAREIPESAQFRAVNAIGTCHINPLPGIRSLLTEGNYTNANPPLPTVAGLKNSVHGDGVFYINSHGGPGFDKNQQAFYAVWTLDPIDPATLANYTSMLATHELVGMLETSNDALGNCTKVMHYGFTDKFVRNRMSFEKNSLVIVDACYSATAPADPLRQAFRGAGASAYVGWSDRVNAPFAYAAMKYLLDRLLGVNQISPETPKQRAFNIYDVREDMATNRNLVTDPTYGGTLTVFPLRDDFGLLSPSIQFLSIESGLDYSELVIAGIFGTDPGAGKRAVRINDQALDVISWEPTLIRCDLPETGSNASGAVVVEVGEGANPRPSNPVNLTEWHGSLVYERDDPGSLAARMDIDVHFRADIHSFRDKPHEQPFETTVFFGAMRDASVVITMSGNYANTQGDCTDTFTFSRTVTLPSPYEPSQDGGWTYLGQVDSQAHTLLLNMNILALFLAGTWVRSGPPECAPYTVQLYPPVQIQECLFDDLQGVTAFRMGMGSDFEVTADTRGPWTVDPLPTYLLGLGLQGQVSVHWSEMTPFFTPDPDAAR